jgi:hypothetical protein
MYKNVHSWPNSQFGGLKDGLFNEAYQASMLCTVAKPAIAPTPSVIKIENASFMYGCLEFYFH